MKFELTQDLVKKLFIYREDGELVWRETGNLAGYENKKGYKYLYIFDKIHLCHRVIFLYHHGFLPDFIDHIDRNPRNNRVENLRACSAAQNLANQSLTKTSKTGYKGVTSHKNGLYQVNICKNYLQIKLGYSYCPHVAAEIYNNAAKELYGDFAALNRIDILKNYKLPQYVFDEINIVLDLII